LYIELAKELKNEDEDDDSVQKFKIKLNQLISLPSNAFFQLFIEIYGSRRWMLKRKNLKSKLLID
jgi:hypothetical protein